MLLGSIVGQAIAFGLLPITARLYSAETIGQAGATLAVLSVVSLIAFWQYDQAVIVVEDGDLANLVLLAVGLLAALTAFLATCLFVADQIDRKFLELLHRYGINYTLIAILLPYGLFLLLVNVQLRSNNLLHVSVARLIYYGGSAVLQVTVASLWEATSRAFLLAQAAAALFALVSLFPYKQLHTIWSQRRQKSWTFAQAIRQIAGVGRKYSDFPKYQAGAQLLNALSLNLPVIVLNSSFSAAWAGWYFMANRLVATPVVLLTQAIGQIFYRDSAERERAGRDQVRSLERIVTVLIQMALIFAVSLGTLAPYVIPVVLGEVWYPVIAILQILLIVFTVTFFTSPITTLLNVKKRQKDALFYYSLLTFVRIIAVTVAWVLQSEWFLIWSYALVSLTVMLPLFRHTVRSAGGDVRRIVANIQPLLFRLGGVLIMSFVLSYFGRLNSWIGAIVVASLLLGIGLLELRQMRSWQTSIS